jgi:hypothetical protein
MAGIEVPGIVPAAEEQMAVIAHYCIYAGQWCCRHCRAKGNTISEVLHHPWCKLVSSVPDGDGRG